METKIIRKNNSVLTGSLLINIISVILARYMFVSGQTHFDRTFLGLALCIIPTVLTVKSMSSYYMSEFCFEERNIFGRPVMSIHMDEITGIGTFTEQIYFNNTSFRYEQYIYFSKADILSENIDLRYIAKYCEKIPYDEQLWEELCRVFQSKINRHI